MQNMGDLQGKAPRIKVQREWVGAPVGTLGNPTFWLFVATLTGFCLVTATHIAGGLPIAATVVLNAVAIYVGFTVMHESMHGIAHANRTVNRWLGRVSGLLLTLPMPLFRAVHYEHHAHTNDAERDPDLFLAKSPWWLLPLWTLGVLVEYRRHFYGRRLWRRKADLYAALLNDAALVCVLAAAAVTGHLGTLLVVWLGPAMLAIVFLAMTFDYLPHYPYDSAERYHDTRIYPGKVANAILLGQNYHLVHHLWTTIPWYRYQRVFAAIRPDLEQRGARIGWFVSPPRREMREQRAA
jgi:beta-carotene hydroxylase